MKQMIGYGLLILLALGSAAGVWAVRADAANQDLKRLLPLSEQIIASDIKVIIKLSSAYQAFTNEADFVQIGRKLSAQLDIQDGSPKVTRDQDHLLYKAAATDSDGIETTLLWVGLSNGTSELIVSAEADHPQETANILQVQKHLTEQLEGIDVKPHWNVMIQGEPAASYTQQESWHSWLVGRLHVQEVGRYEDAGSLSVSYYSPIIRETAAVSGKEKMNLQVAVHRNSNTQQQRITIGTPAISIEY